MRTPETIILLAADSVAKLRSVDVFRVIDDCSDAERKPTARYIVENRPDLAGEINEIWNDEFLLEIHRTDEDCIVGPGNLCVLCHVVHGPACPSCGGKAFHTQDCSAFVGPGAQ